MRAAEAFVDEHGERGGAGPLEPRRELSGIGVGAQVAGRRRAPLDLGDRREPRGGERVAEPHAATASRENATSCSSRSAAAPDSSASRA